MSAILIGQGRSFAHLANEVSDAINRALRMGMGEDEAACVVVKVAADYARARYGNGYLKQLSQVVVKAGRHPLPQDGSAS